MAPSPRRAAPGQMPDRVYWVRRALVLVAIVVAIAIIVAIASAIRGRSSTATPASTATGPVAESSTTPSASPTGQPTTVPTSASATPSASTTSAAPTATTECVPNLLSLAVTGPRSVAASAKADLAVTITNTAQTPCVVVFDSRFVLRVVSGSDEIWSTADCAAWSATGSQTVQPGAAVTWKATWDRHRSQKECKVVPTTLKAGTYVANAMYTGAVPAQWPMNLTA